MKINILKEKICNNYTLALFVSNIGIFWIITTIFFVFLMQNDDLPRFWGVYWIFRLTQDVTFSAVISLLCFCLVPLARKVRFFLLFCLLLPMYIWVFFDLVIFMNSGFRLEISYLGHMLYLREMIVAGDVKHASVQLCLCGAGAFLIALSGSYLGSSRKFLFGRKWVLALFITSSCAITAYFLLPTESVKSYGNSFFKTTCDWLVNRNSYVGSERMKDIARKDFSDSTEICRYVETSDYPVYRHTLGFTGTKNFEMDTSHGPPSHVFMIFIESARGVDCKFTGRTTMPSSMPNLERLAAEGVAFLNFYTGGMGTARGMFAAIFGSMPISSNFTTQMNYYRTSLRGLSHIFLEHKYSTFFYNGYNLGFLRTYKFFHQQRFTNLFGLLEIRKKILLSSTPGEWGIHDMDLFLFALSMSNSLDKGGCKTFNVILTDSSHNPYIIPGQDESVISLLPLKERYRRAIGYTDRQLGLFIENLKKSGLYQKSLIVILGDHGVSLENNKSSYSSLKDQATLVPLVILAPGRLKAPVMISENCSGIDLLPTLVDIMGFTNVANHGVGRSLMRRSEKEHPVFSFCNAGHSMVGIRYRQFKYIFDLTTGKEQLYDLSKDMNEQNDIAGEHPDLSRKFKKKIIDAVALSNSLGLQDKYAPEYKHKIVLEEFKPLASFPASAR